MPLYGKGNPLDNESIQEANRALGQHLLHLKLAYNAAIEAWEEIGLRGILLIHQHVVKVMNDNYTGVDLRLVSNNWIRTYLCVHSYTHDMDLPKAFKHIDDAAYRELVLLEYTKLDNIAGDYKHTSTTTSEQS